GTMGKSKGTRFERDLLVELWKAGFAAIRVAGSGVSPFPCPDIVAGNGRTYLAIEVKMRKELPLYLSADEVEQLVTFARGFGAEAYVALKLPRKKWRFFPVQMLERTEKNFKIDESVYPLGLEIAEVAGKFFQERFGEKV
uniref:HOLLIDAY JUNCTION RESOLVASE n=1 Tax=Archaeoglobus fulgidus TaxID=2234 RepID=UPI00019867CB|nr:Chain A, HOLLIDAY JUNCTION RESOLVASE [Archaeoglobus fulgidus]2WCZ_B Chain B, HOLLIDAY JUNCTION RESOLVASE [Archaeoglobus fulgidus]2WIW_A Chain A, HJC [Archaeoglobus fulgidus]2WIW_B Chain B, HJC [Archaeoglobus fulgidus]2WIZ_A Chain A, ARCHAEAL HJC [Archaeoglobus fulgidus DSM 4304]2WIZ_B Chain B, ARCHAEAL HJC [Archaeoglobus fulgidus DSM 4304]2WJ0_A Chain A, ARCHAEAL HJC [Archaeoglobus fulgidus]2WJ0_B Chain B, ARCHAEAL HJC [Archaeoglobus fulgidus]